MGSLLRTPGEAVAYRVTAFHFFLGGSYGVLTHQVRRHQHRFVLPLFESEARDRLMALAYSTRGIVLYEAGGDEGVIGSRASVLTAQTTDLLPLLSFDQDMPPGTLSAARAEFPFIVRSLSVPKAVSGLKSLGEPEHVSVSALLPARVRTALAH